MEGEKRPLKRRKRDEEEGEPVVLALKCCLGGGGGDVAYEAFVVALLLPDEVWLHIFTFLQAGDLCSLAQTCHRFNLLSQDQSLWYSMFRNALFRYPKLVTKWREWDLMDPHADYFYKGFHSSTLETQRGRIGRRQQTARLGEEEETLERVRDKHDDKWEHLCLDPLATWAAIEPHGGAIGEVLHQLDPERKPEEADELAMMDMLDLWACDQETVKQAAKKAQFKETVTKVNKDLWMPSKSGEAKTAKSLIEIGNEIEGDSMPLSWKKVYLQEAKDQAMANVWATHIGAKWHHYYDAIPSSHADRQVKTLLSAFLKRGDCTSKSAQEWWDRHKERLIQKAREAVKEREEEEEEEKEQEHSSFNIHMLLDLIKSYPLLLPHFVQILEGQLQGHPLLGWSPFHFVNHSDPPSSAVQNLASMPRIAFELAEAEQELEDFSVSQLRTADVALCAVKELDVLRLSTLSKPYPFQVGDLEEEDLEAAETITNDRKADYDKLVHPQIWWSRREQSFALLKVLLAQQQQLHHLSHGPGAAECIYTLFEQTTTAKAAIRTDQPSTGEEIMMAMAGMVECLSWQEMYELKRELYVNPPEWYPEEDALHGGPRVLAREPWELKFWTSNFRALGIVDHSLIPIQPLGALPFELLKGHVDEVMDFICDDHSLHHSIHMLMRKAGVAYSEPDTCSFALIALQEWMDSVISSVIQKMESEQHKRSISEVTAEDIHSVLATNIGMSSGLHLESENKCKEETKQELPRHKESTTSKVQSNIFRRHGITLYPFPQEPLQTIWNLSSATSFQLMDTLFDPRQWNEQDEELEETELQAFDAEFLQEMFELTQDDNTNEVIIEEETKEDESESSDSDDWDPWAEPVPSYISQNFGQQSCCLFQHTAADAKLELKEFGISETFQNATSELRIGPHYPKFILH
ncbi:F-box only protein 11 [Balamuthia mandrillaris]